MGGIKDEAKFKVINCPAIRATNWTHTDFKKLIKYICAMAKDFKLVEVTTDEPDGGIQWILEVLGKGTEIDGRIIDRLVLWFTINFENEELLIGAKAWEKIIGFYGALKLDKNLQEKGWLVQQSINVTGYDLTNNEPPKRFAFTLKYMPEKQIELEKEALERRRNDIKQRRNNEIADAIKNDDRVRTQIKRVKDE